MHVCICRYEFIPSELYTFQLKVNIWLEGVSLLQLFKQQSTKVEVEKFKQSEHLVRFFFV